MVGHPLASFLLAVGLGADGAGGGVWISWALRAAGLSPENRLLCPLRAVWGTIARGPLRAAWGTIAARALIPGCIERRARARIPGCSECIAGLRISLRKPQ